MEGQIKDIEMKDIISDEADMCMVSRIIRQYQQRQVHPYYHQKISIILTATKLIKAKLPFILTHNRLLLISDILIKSEQ
jgi:3-hydroxymyristoyl/3-hydroxydecanoyl-(acyl carrier protein) dehydratase